MKKTEQKRPDIPENIEIDATSEINYDWKAPTMLKVVENLSSLGYTKKEISALLGVRDQTFSKHLKRVPILDEKLVTGRSEPTQQMVASMFDAAKGGRVIQKKKTKIDCRGRVSFEIEEKELPADPALMIFWLTNADPENWRQFRNIIHMNKEMELSDDTLLESDKIARLSRKVFESDSNGVEGEHSVQEEAPHSNGTRALNAGNVSGDVSGETADHVQDDVLDVPAEEGAEPV